MSRYRLIPTPAQEAVLRDHCGHARYVWNLAVEQHSWWHPGRKSAPGYLQQCRQLTQARAQYPWLAEGSQTVQQQALRDFAQAMAAFLDPGNPAGRPSWRKAGRHEGFRIVGRGRQWDVRRLSRKTGEVWVPKAGWVRFRWSRPVPAGAKSYRVTQDRAGADQAAAAGAQARTRQAGIKPPQPGNARGRPAAGPRDGPAQRLGREDQHGNRAAVRPDPGRRPADRQHDPVGERHPGEPGTERPAESWAEPGHPGVGVGAAGAAAGG